MWRGLFTRAVLAKDARVKNPRQTNFEAGGTTALPT
jgi:hypothetical protein